MSYEPDAAVVGSRLRVDCHCSQVERSRPPLEPLARHFCKDYDNRTARYCLSKPEEGLPSLLQPFCHGRFVCNTYDRANVNTYDRA